MPYVLRNKKKVSGATILWIILGVFYCACGITIICIWLTHKRNIKETGKVLLETKKSADAVIKEQLDTVSEIGGKKIGELTEHMVKAARPDEEDKAREEADAAAREALYVRLRCSNVTEGSVNAATTPISEKVLIKMFPYLKFCLI